MKTKIFIYIILILSFFSLPAYADYPVIPDSVVEECKIRFGINDEGSRLLYEKIYISEDKYAWMLVWFHEDCKTVVGITDESDVIYYNRAPLSEDETEKKTLVTHLQGLEIAEEFLKKSVSKPNLTLISDKAYTYKFAEYYHGIRVISHDATVVVDKSSGKVCYYKGFGDIGSEYKFMNGLISKDYAYNIYFDKIGLEAAYICKYSDDRKVKTARPVYIANKLQNRAVDAENGGILNISMTDYNYYNDLYYDGKYFRDNNISTDLGIFEKNALADEENASYITNLVPSLKKGYHFKVVDGKFNYYGGTSVPAYEIDFVPKGYETNIDGYINDYNQNIFDNIYETDTQIEFLYGKAYINAANGKIIKYDAVKNPKYKTTRKLQDGIPSRVSDILKFGTANFDGVKYFGDFYEDEKTLVYCFARYENNIRAIGEGTLVKYDTDLNEITYLCENFVTDKFPNIEYSYSVKDIAAAQKETMPFGICYVDGADGRKIAVYDILDNNVTFDPLTGNRIDITDMSDTSTLFVCSVNSEKYTVNGVAATAPCPIINNGAFYVPFRFIAENNGYTVSYDNGTISAETSNDIIELIPDVDAYYVNYREVTLPHPIIINDTTYVSLSSVNVLFGLHSSWDEETNSVFIYN